MQSPGNQGFMVVPRNMLGEMFHELGEERPLTKSGKTKGDT